VINIFRHIFTIPITPSSTAGQASAVFFILSLSKTPLPLYFSPYRFHFNEKLLLLYYGLLWANVVIPITLCRVYHHDTPYFSAILEQKH
jgi:membrane protein YdbS with pleckstrin-like domain